MSAAAVHVPPGPDEAGPPPPVALLDLLVAGWTSRMLIALCRLGVPDALGDDARTARELAAELEIDPTRWRGSCARSSRPASCAPTATPSP